ncbi:Spo0E family sporulation regulatory protein-aspartic acid phosphatase [Brevibacillus laterosporus]|uniref:Spo0E family sporulation regulatory protein-aspartic acid phosphatase n=1 Tax=Brevibacillus laterosporus TaxID=1465 RepID=UPI003D1B320C
MVFISFCTLILKDLLKAVEDLKRQLVELHRREGSFLSPAVLHLSQQIDEYIVVIQKITKKIK